MKIILELFTKHKFFILALFLCLFTVLPLFKSGLPPTHDGEYHVIRFFEFDKVLRSGVLYPIWAPDLNYTYGSPLFLYVYPLPNYVASLFHSLGLSLIDSFKFNLALATIVGSVGMYMYGNYKFGKWGGLLGSVAYTYAPYHALDVYIRGSVGEVWALGLFPLFLFIFEAGLKEKNLKKISLGSVVFSFIVFSHNILSVMFLAFLLCYVLFLINTAEKKIVTFIYAMLPIVLGMLLASIFVLPALLEQKYVVGLKVFDVMDHFPEVYQLLVPSWGAGYSGISTGTQMSFQIGIANIFIILLVLWGLFRKKISPTVKKSIYFFLSVFIFILFLITPYSRLIWENIESMQLFQFPWRFLSIIILSTSILAASVTGIYKSRMLYVVVLVFIIFSTFSYHSPPYYLERDDSYYTENDNFLYGTNSIGNAFQTKWLPQQDKVPGSKAILISGEEVRVTHLKPEKQTFEAVLNEKDIMIINTAFFPGWTVYVNDKKQHIFEDSGKIKLHLEKGRNVVELKLENTDVKILGKILSSLALIFICLILIRKSATIKV